MQQNDYEMLFVNMKFEPMFIKEYLTLKWHCQGGIIENIQKVVEEYRIQRNLTVEFSRKICKKEIVFSSRSKFVFSDHLLRAKQPLPGN